MHALVIEDDPTIARLIGDELRELGYATVDIAASEEEAIIAVAQTCPDLITSEGSLISGSGVGAVHRIRASLPVPVVFITADAEYARHYGACGPVLQKPFSIAQLIMAVEEARQFAAAES